MRAITVALAVSQVFGTINIHTLIKKTATDQHFRHHHEVNCKLHHGTQSLHNIQKHTSIQRQFKTGVPHGGVLSATIFNIYTVDLLPHRAPVQVMSYADDITITSTHTSTSVAKKYIQRYLHKVFAWTKHSNLTLNPD